MMALLFSLVVIALAIFAVCKVHDHYDEKEGL